MRTKLVILAAALQVLVLVYMAAEREWVIQTGQIIHLRTAPVDPRDAFRGDYVHLDYEISHIPTNQLRGSLATAVARPYGLTNDTRIYAALEVTPDGLAHLEYAADRRPETGLFIRGRTEPTYGRQVVSVRYGIEAYFVQQDKGHILEEARRRDEIQVPLEMEVAVARNGLAVLRGYRWSPLGIGLQLVTATNRQVRAATVRLLNASSNDLAIVDLPDARSLTLDPDQIREWSQNDWTWVGRGSPRPPVTDDDLHVLKPGQIHEIHVDLTSPDWFVLKSNEMPRAVGGLDWGSMFRLVYRPPTEEECAHLKEAALIWHGTLMSRAFGGGRVD